MSAEVQIFLGDLLHRCGIDDRDRFTLRTAHALQTVKHWDARSIRKEVGAIKTDLYLRNSSVSREEILELIALELIKRWSSSPFDCDEENPSVIKVLFIAANPVTMIGQLADGTVITKAPLGLDEEFRAIKEKVRAAKFRDAVELIPCLAARSSDLIQTFNEVQPQVVHFSGHGSNTDELVLLKRDGGSYLLPKQSVESLFRTMKDNIRVVVLNACFSKSIAFAITKHIDCTVGMAEEVPDETATIFAAAFYGALAFGRSVKQAFQQGLTELQLQGVSGDHIPKLLTRRGVDAAKVKLL